MAAATDVVRRTAAVALVCQHLSPGSFSVEGGDASAALKERQKRQKSLVRLAQVCRGVSCVALDALWEYIDDFRNLLHVFKAYDPEKSMFTDVINDAEWSRFQGYALRIRELHVGDISRVHSTVWITLTRRSPHGSLLPRLERLTGLNLTSDSLPYTMLFSPPIRYLDVTVDAGVEQGVIRMVMQELLPILSSLQTLTVTEPACEGLRSAPPAIRFWECAKLRTLKVTRPTDLTREMIDSLASIESLRSLHMQIKSLPSLNQDEKVPQFFDLRDLALCGRLADVSAFLKATKPSGLQSSVVPVARLFPQPALDPIHTSLAPSLCRFSAVLRCDCISEYHFPYCHQVLAPLCTARYLRDISLIFEGGKFHLSDATLVDVQDAWPELTAFTIATRPPVAARVTPRYYHAGRLLVPVELHYSASDDPTVKTLAAFARAHPHLERLTVPSIDLDAVPDLDTVPALGHKLRHFSVCTLAPGVPLFDHALALDRLFPELDLGAARNCVGHGSGKPEDRNGELQLLLLALQTGRLRARRTSAVDQESTSEVRLILRGRYLEPRGPSRPQATREQRSQKTAASSAYGVGAGGSCTVPKQERVA
ncbi:hypothetical protein PYCCODRAFT_1454430 [Trametes coccinea BRFM310]|uniref:F-box domain-containing protein n=1 Tax=Trametes coccinea (strain BRFM310) TaxID=1353009 RepID=A0A1Y2IBG0_TRAC3|nr:hypothetical protein PYCCODRAFT_1454430 [Trametes coccinea BRFM310]